MTRLNSKLTYLNKYLFPLVWFGFLLFFFIKAPQSAKTEVQYWVFTVAPFPMALFGYFLMRRFFFRLVNEVYRQGDTIICRNGGEEARIKLSDIQTAIYYTQTQPHKFVLRIKYETPFGREIEFVPKIGWRIFSFNADIERLLDDVLQQTQTK